MASTGGGGGGGGNKNGVSGQVVCDGGQESSGGRIYVCGQWRSTTAMTTKAGDGGHGRGVVKRGCVGQWVVAEGRESGLARGEQHTRGKCRMEKRTTSGRRGAKG